MEKIRPLSRRWTSPAMATYTSLSEGPERGRLETHSSRVRFDESGIINRVSGVFSQRFHHRVPGGRTERG